MGLISVPVPNDGETIDASDLANPLNTIVSAINGNLDSNNLAANAVTASKIATGAVTASKIPNGELTNEKSSSTNQEIRYFTPAGNSDITSSSMADWITGFDNLNVPSWATKARVSCVVGYTTGSASADISTRLVIGSDNGTSFKLAQNSFPTGGAYYKTLIDEITLTSTGTKTVKLQAQRTAGVGFLRGTTYHDYAILVTYLP